MTTETTLRLGLFFGVFIVMALWERGVPMRAFAASWLRRWATNWSISIVNAVMVKILFGAAATGAALNAAIESWGLFNWLDWPYWIELALAFLALDFAIWLQHLVSHKIPILWRLHRVHHADRDMDVTTAIRFHPIEIALSMGLKIGLIYALGASVAVVIAFEVVLNGAAMFNHGNVRMPVALDRVLRRLIVTLDMHRVHHSVERAEHDANYGFNLSIWDRIIRTYVDQPIRGHEAMTIGLNQCQDDGPTRLGWSLVFPIIK